MPRVISMFWCGSCRRLCGWRARETIPKTASRDNDIPQAGGVRSYGRPTTRPRPAVLMYTTPKVFMSPTTKRPLPGPPYWWALSLMRVQEAPASVERNKPRTPPTVLRDHSGPVTGVAFAADGRHLASTGRDGTVRVWDWRAPRTPPTVLRGHSDHVKRVAFAADGRHLVSAGGDGTVRLWNCQRCGGIEHVLKLARSRLPREIDARDIRRTP